MTDDKSKRGAQDRRTVAGSERYELDYEAEKLGVKVIDEDAWVKLSR